ncbi:MAG TPA: TIGR01777 family oxidoreductase [Solirubrobacteraceae bacterium]|nr:TIGR01777 family oxidoreductase [Solirubrobacteraceae bacterium]
MRVVLTGATGVIGDALSRALLAQEHEVLALTRDVERARTRLDPRVQPQAWPDPMRTPPPASALAGADAVVHLLGEPIAQRWSARVKRAIEDSRVLSTRWLLAALADVDPERRPRTLVSQSATGYYGARSNEPLAESASPGSDFLATVTQRWEHEASRPLEGLRVALTRTGVVLSPRGGALAKMLPPFRLGVGGPVGGGRQYVPWVHLDDVVGALAHCLADERAAGPINVTAPAPATNAQLARALGRALHRPAVLPVPALALRVLYGEMASIVLSGQRALPARLQQLGYRFRHPELADALEDVLARA